MLFARLPRDEVARILSPHKQKWWYFFGDGADGIIKWKHCYLCMVVPHWRGTRGLNKIQCTLIILHGGVAVGVCLPRVPDGEVANLGRTIIMKISVMFAWLLRAEVERIVRQKHSSGSILL